MKTENITNIKFANMLYKLTFTLCINLCAMQHIYAAAEMLTENSQKQLNEQLLQAAQTRIDDRSNKTPATQINHATRNVQRLLAQGASPLYQDKETGNTALHYAIKVRWQRVTDRHATKPDWKYIKFSIENRQAKREYRESIILANMIASLISAGADVRQPNYQGKTVSDLIFDRDKSPDPQFIQYYCELEDVINKRELDIR